MRCLERGFTLLEVVIAAAILAGCLVAIQTSVGASARNLRAAADAAATLALAEALLAVELEAPDATAGSRRGRDRDGRDWRVERTLVQPATPRVALWIVRAEVGAGPRSGRGLVLQTLQLAPPPP